MKNRLQRISKIEELTYELKVRQAMSKRVITVSPRITINRLRTIMRDHGISGVPVLSRDRMIGIISMEDLIKCLMNREMDARVGTKMTREVASTFPDEPLVHTIYTLESTGHGRLPVVDRRTGRLVGILTKGDIILCLLHKLEELYSMEERHRYQAGHLFDDLSGEDLRLTFASPIKKGDFKRAGVASSRLRQNLVKLGIPMDTVRRTAIAAYESEMNMVIYSNGGVMETCVERHRVVVQARDTGPGIPDINKAMTPGYSTAADWVRELGFGAGMGLPNIQQHSDHLSIKSEIGRYTNVTFEVRLP